MSHVPARAGEILSCSIGDRNLRTRISVRAQRSISAGGGHESDTQHKQVKFPGAAPLELE
jgi:hypothetical protein